MCLKLERMLADHSKLLYPNCENGQKKLGSTLELLQWKAENGINWNQPNFRTSLILEDSQEINWNQPNFRILM